MGTAYDWSNPSLSPLSLPTGAATGPIYWNDAGGGSSGGILGALPSILGGMGDLGSVLGAQASGDQSAAFQQGQLNQGANSNLINLYGAQQNAQNQLAQLDLARQQVGTNNRAQTAKQALIGALLGGGMQPTHLSAGNVQGANVSGGLLNSLLSNPAARQAMLTMGSQASTAQNTPLSFQGGNLVQAPTLNPVPNVQNGGAKAKTGGILQDIGSIAGAVAPFLAFL